MDRLTIEGDITIFDGYPFKNKEKDNYLAHTN